MGQSIVLCHRNEQPCDACVRHFGKDEGHDSVNLQASKGTGVWFDDSLLARACAGSSSADPSRQYILQSRRKLFRPHFQNRFRDFYLLGHKLGDGASADVFVAFARPIDRISGLPMMPIDDKVAPPSNARRFAVKVFTPVKSHSSHKPYKETPKNLRDFFKNEWEMLSQLEHPHIVRMYECFQEESTLYIVMEMCYGGELIEHVREVTRIRQKGGLEERDARHLFRQMLYAAIYLSHHRIVHRDIKLENFLLVGASESAGVAIIKLCDFGTAVQLSDKMPRASGRIGTLSYTAPEICTDRGATVQADAWSLGVVLYVLFVGAKPFKAKNEESRDETMQRIIDGTYNTSRRTWLDASAAAQDLVELMIVVDEDKRMTVGRAIQHKWCAIDAPSIDSMHHNGDMNFAAPHIRKLVNHVTSLDPLQQFVMSLCSKLLDESNLVYTVDWALWYNFFYALDANKDGRLDFSELTQGFWSLCGQVSSKQLSATLQTLDLNGSGSIEWTEWAAVALLSLGGFPLQDELLATAARLLAPREDDITTPTKLLPELYPPTPTQATSREDTLSDGFAQAGRPQLSPERIQQLRERFAAWVPFSGSTANASRDLCLAGLREILESTSWFELDCSSESLPEAGQIAIPLAIAQPPLAIPPTPPQTQGQYESPLENWELAASPRDKWSPRGPQGPSTTKSAAFVLPMNLSSSAPNSVTASQATTPQQSPLQSPRDSFQ